MIYSEDEFLLDQNYKSTISTQSSSLLLESDRWKLGL